MIGNSTNGRHVPQQAPSDGFPVLIDAAEVAKMLGISPRSVWRLRSGGKIIEPLRVGGLVRWRRDQILDWIERGCPAVKKPLDQAR